MLICVVILKQNFRWSLKFVCNLTVEGFFEEVILRISDFFKDNNNFRNKWGTSVSPPPPAELVENSLYLDQQE
jgi:hypothetical protein